VQKEKRKRERKRRQDGAEIVIFVLVWIKRKKGYYGGYRMKLARTGLVEFIHQSFYWNGTAIPIEIDREGGISVPDKGESGLPLCALCARSSRASSSGPLIDSLYDEDASGSKKPILLQLNPFSSAETSNLTTLYSKNIQFFPVRGSFIWSFRKLLLRSFWSPSSLMPRWENVSNERVFFNGISSFTDS